MNTHRIAVVTDSTSDISIHLAEELGIRLIPLNLHFGNEVYLDQFEITTDEFMKKMETTDKLPTTSQPSVGAFEEAYRSLAADHDAIIVPTISSKLSGTYQSACIAAENVEDVIRVEVVDSTTASWALGLQVVRALELIDEGLSVEEIATILQAETHQYHLLFFVETLEHLRRGGRIGKAAQMVGSLLQLRPLLTVEGGQIVPFERTRTRGKAIKALENWTRDLAPLDDIVVLWNTTPGDAANLANTVSDLISDKEVKVSQLSPVLDAHLGPDVLGIAVREK